MSTPAPHSRECAAAAGEPNKASRAGCKKDDERPIRPLKDSISRLIWASAVVPSLADVVSRLVENAVCAGAQRVWVSVATARSLRVRVVDDGKGFAESALQQVCDETNEATFLNALGVLSSLEIRSRGHRGWLRMGKCLQVAAEQGTNATEVDVWDLFDNLPVRKEASLTQGGKSERKSAVAKVRQIAAFAPDTAFTVENEETKQVLCELAVDAASDYESRWKARLRQIYGPKVFHLETIYSAVDCGVAHVVALLARTQSLEICSGVCLNNRVLRPEQLGLYSLLDFQIHRRMSDLLPTTREEAPLYLVKVTCEPKNDFHNVQNILIRMLSDLKAPSKPIVEEEQHGTLVESNSKSSNRLLSALEQQEARGKPKSSLSAPSAGHQGGQSHTDDLLLQKTMLDSFKCTKRPRSAGLPLATHSFGRFSPLPRRMPSLQIPKLETFSRMEVPDSESRGCWHSFPTQTTSISREAVFGMRVVGQVDAKFVALENSGDIFMLDQHAGDERVRYERLYKLAAKSLSREFCSAICLELSSEMGARVQACPGELLEAWGWSFADLNNGLLVSKTVPRIFGVVLDDERNLLSFVTEVTAGLSKSQIPRFALEAAANCACHSAIRFGDILSFKECEKLVSDLSICEYPFQCAHGRPSLVPVAFIERH